MTYSKAIMDAFNKYNAVRINDIDPIATTPAQKMVQTKAFRKLVKLIEAEGLSVNKVVPHLEMMAAENEGFGKDVVFEGWNKL